MVNIVPKTDYVNTVSNNISALYLFVYHYDSPYAGHSVVRYVSLMLVFIASYS